MHPTPVILLVDGCDRSRSVLSRVLRMNGLDTLCAFTDIQALDLAIRHRPDLVIITVDSFGVDGLQVHRELQKVAALRQTPTLAVTSSDAGEQLADLMVAGFHGVIVKPVTLDNYVRTAWEMLGWLNVALES